MHDVATRQRAIAMLEQGLTRRDVCRILDVGYNSTYRWQQRLEPMHRSDSIFCFRCQGQSPPDQEAYLYLLGQYLGDGHIRKNGMTRSLGICCCTHYAEILCEV
jgi:hypothetical protein